MTKNELTLKRFFQLLGDDNKFKIVSELIKGEKCVCVIYKELGLDQTLVSHHLSVLKKAGIIKGRKFGRWVYYSINKEVFKNIGEIFNNLLGIKNISDKKRVITKPFPILSCAVIANYSDNYICKSAG